MSIGSNIKKLRKEREITQEQLADLLHLTPSAISQWETDRVLPDVTQIPQLSNIFRVSADVILGIDVDAKDARIGEFYNKVNELSCAGRKQEAVEVCRAGLAEFPDAYDLMKELADNLIFVDYEGAKPELISLYERILEGSKDECQKNVATCELCRLYTVTGRKEDAKRLAESVPVYIYTAEDCWLATLTGKEWIDAKRAQIHGAFNRVLWDIRNIVNLNRNGRNPYFTVEEQLELYRKLIVFVETYYENGDYGFDRELLAEVHFCRSLIFAETGDPNAALDSLECALHHILESDRFAEGLIGASVTWPKEKWHTSILPRSDMDDTTWTAASSTANSAMEYLEKLADERFDPIRETDRYRAVEKQLSDAAKE